MKVLLAIDGSSQSEAAVVQVAGLPWPNETVVEVLTVIHPTIPMFTEPTLVVAAMSVQEADELRQRAPQLVDMAREQIRRGAPALKVTTKILDGVPAHTIVEEARDWGADLIVVGSHGFGFMKRMLLGSVAGAVVANAPCSVYVVRSRSAADNGVSAGAVNTTP
jgi:nucleotide-binding universal stress UspA family protein